MITLSNKYENAAEEKEELDNVIDNIKKDLMEFVKKLAPSGNEALIDRLLAMCKCTENEIKEVKKARIEQFGRQSLAL